MIAERKQSTDNFEGIDVKKIAYVGRALRELFESYTQTEERNQGLRPRQGTLEECLNPFQESRLLTYNVFFDDNSPLEGQTIEADVKDGNQALRLIRHCVKNYNASFFPGNMLTNQRPSLDDTTIDITGSTNGNRKLKLYFGFKHPRLAESYNVFIEE